MTWLYNGREFTEDDAEGYAGFIYLITELDTGRQYIGQKIFRNKVSKKPLKGKTKRRIVRKQSDWLEYFGSNDELKQLVAEKGTENYKREILRLCKAKSEMNYWESYEIFNRHALLQPDKYFNAWVSARINRNQIKSMIGKE